MNRSKRVYVYFNLHKKVWSVRQNGKVVEHTKSIMLKDCKYLVGKAGREKVLREKKKNEKITIQYWADIVHKIDTGIDHKLKTKIWNLSKINPFFEENILEHPENFQLRISIRYFRGEFAWPFIQRY